MNSWLIKQMKILTMDMTDAEIMALIRNGNG